MKKFITITLVTIIFILLSDYIFNCIASGEILSYMNVELRQIGTISTFIAMIYFTIKFSDKGEIISYFLPALVWYLITVTVFKFEIFSSVIVTIPSVLFFILITVGILAVGVCLHKSIVQKKQSEI